MRRFCLKLYLRKLKSIPTYYKSYRFPINLRIKNKSKLNTLKVKYNTLKSSRTINKVIEILEFFFLCR